MNITYRQVGDYFIPNIDIAEEDKQPIDKYGMMRKCYLKNHKENMLNRDFHADRPNQKWVTDISYIHKK